MKIMVWNIEKFTVSKFGTYFFTGGGPLAMRKRKSVDTDERVEYMRRIVGAGAGHIPHVIAILETMADTNTAIGTPLTQARSPGVTQFLAMISAQTGNANWRVVPPIKCNPANPAPGNPWAAQEVVAVFYDSARVTFQGPDYWTAAGIQRPGPPAPAAIDYPAPWNDVNITDATQRAGRIAHTNMAGAPVRFPAEMNRRPFMVDFREVGGAARLFRCLFVHTSPGTHLTGTAQIATIRDMQPANNETAAPNYFVACGDFNVNSYSAGQIAAAYAPLNALNYQTMLNTGNTDSTHYKRTGRAAPQNWHDYKNHKVIDNFLVVRNPNPQPVTGGWAKIVVDSVEQQPAPWGPVMAQTLAAINLMPTGPTLRGPTATFRLWPNFKCIITTSDHLPTYLEIP